MISELQMNSPSILDLPSWALTRRLRPSGTQKQCPQRKGFKLRLKTEAESLAPGSFAQQAELVEALHHTGSIVVEEMLAPKAKFDTLRASQASALALQLTAITTRGPQQRARLTPTLLTPYMCPVNGWSSVQRSVSRAREGEWSGWVQRKMGRC